MPSPPQSSADAKNLRSLLKAYLYGLQAHGLQRMSLDDDGRAILREWMLAKRSDDTVPPAVNHNTDSHPGKTEHTEQPAAGNASRLSELADSSEAPSPESDELQPVFFRPPGNNRAEIWQNAQALLLRWDPLRSLGTLRDTMIWGEGSPNASIVFVGDAPNFSDEQGGHPFCGDTGTKLDEMLRAMGLSRQQVYITYLVKFRPKLPRQTTNNRPPEAEEIRLSLPVLEFEIRYIQPKVIVALGVVAARGLLGRGDLPLSAYQQMSNLQFCDIPVIVTHNPSYLLRTSDRGERRRLWEEMLRVLELANLPISDKQRGYFLPH